MTQTEYEQNKRECWEEYCRTHKTLINGEDTYIIEHGAFSFAFDRAYALGKREKKAAAAVISGWVARDKDGLLNFFYGGSTPYKNDNDGDWNTAFGRVLEYLPREMFPDLTWDSEPEEIEIILKRKQKTENQ